MAKKKNDKKKPAARPRKRSAEVPPDLPDRRLIEREMRRLAAGMAGNAAPDTPLSQAQELIYQAMEEPSERRRIALARKALELSPDCADAHVLLAELAPSRKKAIEEYELGVAAGERALGPEMFRDNVGHFWGILETRPYMRARLGLAQILWTTARRDEAVQHLQEMLRLNPGDNQGARYTLAGFLLFLDRDDELARLLDQYPDEASAAWDYTRALLAFRKHGDTAETRKLFQKAMKTNRHVPDYLVGAEFPPPEPPDYYSPGDASEAVEYIGNFLAGWKFTPGAIAWVRANLAKPKKPTKTKGPTAAGKKTLGKLRQEDDVWQADVRLLPSWIIAEGEAIRPSVLLVTSLTNRTVLGHEITEEPPTPELLWDTLAEAMRHPAMGKGHRPTTIEVRSGEIWESLRPHLDELGIALAVQDKLPQFDEVFAMLAEQFGGENRPGLLAMPGMTPERVGAFYEAAAEFYRRMPWKRVGFEAAIKIACDKFESGPWYAVLMGQSGLAAGIALYEDLALLREMWTGNADNEENARRTVGTSVTFGEEWETTLADVEAAKKFGWPVARPNAYPEVFHKERGMSMRSPLVWELELIEGCLRAVPDFVERRRQDNTTPEEFVVPTAGGPLKLVLSWIPEADDTPPAR